MKKQILIFALLVLLLLGFNKLLQKGFVKNYDILTSGELVNHEHVESQRLFDRAWSIVRKNYLEPDMNKQHWQRWKEHYRGKIKTDEDATVAINTMLASLDDPYSRFLDKKDYDSQNVSIDSKINGIGVNISSISGKIVVVGVVEDTPAYAAKLQVKDIILKVNGKDVKGMPIADVANIVRGPENSFVEITVLRKNKIFVKKIKRQQIKIKTVKSSIDKDSKIGYIQILTFIGSTTPTEFVSALEKTSAAEGLIIDLRGNTGGLLPNAVFIANMFIPKGNIVSIVGRNGYHKNIYAQEINGIIEKPMLILVDGGSASASEILSGALKDYHKAKLVGTKTFGKGMVQKIIPMPNQTGLDLTIAKYLTPAGHDINKKGINPDIKVEFTKKDILARKDVQLIKAKEILAHMIEKDKKN